MSSLPSKKSSVKTKSDKTDEPKKSSSGSKKRSSSKKSSGDGKSDDNNIEFTVTLNPVWVMVAVGFIALLVLLYRCKRNEREEEIRNTSPPASATSKPFKLESLIARTFSKKDSPENQTADEASEIFKKASAGLRKNNEKSVGQIQGTFKDASKDLKRKKENFLGNPPVPPIRKWHVPPGFQPGTLTVPDVGYVTTETSNVDQGFPGQKSAAKYSGPQSFTRTIAVNSDGSLSSAINESFSDNFPNGLMPPYSSKEKLLDPIPRSIRHALDNPRENEIANELGTTDHSWSSSNNLSDGITGETWNGDRTDWAEQKAKMKDAMVKIGSLFDALLTEKIYPDAEYSVVPGGQIQIKSDGSCVSLERYYEYVSNTIAAQMGASPQFPMEWARGSKIKLGLENIESSIDDLRKVLVSDDCGVFYAPQPDKTLVSSSSGKKVSYNVIWPQDGSVLLTHEMKKA